MKKWAKDMRQKFKKQVTGLIVRRRLHDVLAEIRDSMRSKLTRQKSECRKPTTDTEFDATKGKKSPQQCFDTVGNTNACFNFKWEKCYTS